MSGFVCELRVLQMRKEYRGYKLKRKLFFMFLVFQLAAAFTFAGVHVSESTFASPDAISAQNNPQTALNTHTGQTLVVWQRSQVGSSWDTTILGRIVNAKGKTTSGELKLATGVVSGYLGNPSVTYNPLLNEFLIAYDATGGGISVRRIAANGKPSGKAVNITTDPISANASNYSPKVTFNPTTQGYTVIWIRDNGETAIVVALSVTKTGKPNGAVLEIRPGYFFTLDLASLPSGNKVLALFYEGNNYYLAILDPYLKSAQVAKVNTTPAIRKTETFWWAASLAVLPDSSAIVFYADESGVKGRKINPDGKLNGKPFVAFRAPESSTRLLNPSAIFSTTSKGTRGILVATRDDDPSGGATSFAQVLDSTGASIGAPILVNSTSETETTLAGQISVLPVKPGSNVFLFQLYQTVGQKNHGWSTGQVAPLNTEILKFKLSLTEP
jgi:hypothetical protein